MAKLRPVLGATVVATALAVSVLAVPQAVAAEKPVVRIADYADAQTRAFAQANPQEVAAAMLACGPDYKLSTAIPLPKGTDPKMRLATLFSYTRGGNDFGCSILDNNMGSASYKMKVSVCGSAGACSTDQGNYLNYAGPVFTGQPVCATVSALMWNPSGGNIIDYKTQHAYLCD
ncbi:hypothetical protein AF335_09805 [Streptomyces eurocidicus]|uniref:Secreted protein n=1 Tax=Streptomyces eurocidicus TaxID=66423 RepID=A0A2N8NWU2_STREU|nr:hypothetical protein [Streptomyces eurocidicus]MBB5117980.1 hypothetical protein [Streptomyces eurocidicus]MBF6053959.1 hypothetical protein [Streptomyces eurocidicus]PNE33219.1 hypothetical protein AF335_09805 [Streptomyces eurocidicus]